MADPHAAPEGPSPQHGINPAADTPQQRIEYKTRALLLAVVAPHSHETVISWNDPHQPTLPVLYLHTEQGLLTFHIHPDDLQYLRHIPQVDVTDPRAQWDGADKLETLARLVEFVTATVDGSTEPPESIADVDSFVPEPDWPVVPPDLFHELGVEPGAGTILPALTGKKKRYRPNEEWEPNWEYLLTNEASKKAVVAGLCLYNHGMPEKFYPTLIHVHCPQTWAMLTAAGVSVEQWLHGHVSSDLSHSVGAMINHELGYRVFDWVDWDSVGAATAKAIGRASKAR